MPDILHKLSIGAPREKVFQALATREGLSRWWTSTTEGDSVPGQTLTFRFGEHVVKMRVDELQPGSKVAWECTTPGDEWLGTRLTFDLSEDNGRTTLRFGHRQWAQAGDFFAHCSTKWATFLLSLREYAETGKGRPFPHDLIA